MSDERISRRRLLHLTALAAALPVIQACGSAATPPLTAAPTSAPAPTTAPASPTAPATTASPTTAAQPTTAPATTAPQGATRTYKFTWWMWPTNDKHIPQQFPYLKQVVPNADFEVVTLPSDFWTKLQATFVAGSGAPDITLLEIGFVAQAVNTEGALVELTPYINQNWPGLMDKFFPAPVKAAQDRKGRQMAFPKEFGPSVMFYRVDLLQKAGFPTDDPSAMHKLIPTWDAIIDQGQKVFKKDDVWLLPTANSVLTARRSQLGWIPVKEGKPNLQAPEIEESLALAKKFYDGGYTSEKQGDAFSAAVAGSKIAFFQDACFYTSILLHAWDKNGAGKWRITDAASGSFNEGGDFYAVTSQCQGGEDGRATAVKVIEWFATDHHKFDYAWNEDLSPGAYKPLFESDPITKQGVPYLGNQVVGDIIARAAADLKPPVLDPQQGIVFGALTKAADSVFHKGTDVKQALQAAQKEAEQNMK